ncbi:MAG: hypothetical protein ABFS39_17395 [Pseudomonadota bacterium]
MVHGIKAANTFLHPELMSTLLKAGLESPLIADLSPDKKTELVLKAHMIIYALVNDDERLANLRSEDIVEIFPLLLKLNDPDQPIILPEEGA